MKALIDGDIVAYRCAASAENDPLDIALVRTDQLMRQILEKVRADFYDCYLSGDSNFRSRLYPEYKANRRKVVRPLHLTKCKEYLVKEWKASITDGYEADDALGMAQSIDLIAPSNNSFICSIDKDLLQVPGHHYNFVRDEFKFIDDTEGMFRFYYQLLVGDPTDNVKGVLGIGDKKARRLLENQDPDDWFQIVRDTFNDDDHMLLTGRLIWIWRKENDLWSPKELMGGMENSGPVVEAQRESTPPMPEEIGQHMEPTS